MSRASASANGFRRAPGTFTATRDKRSLLQSNHNSPKIGGTCIRKDVCLKALEETRIARLPLDVELVLCTSEGHCRICKGEPEGVVSRLKGRSGRVRRQIQLVNRNNIVFEFGPVMGRFARLAKSIRSRSDRGKRREEPGILEAVRSSRQVRRPSACALA